MEKKETMLGRILVILVTVPAEMLGALVDLIEKLVSKEGREWFAAFKKFLRKEEVWAKQVVNTILVLDPAKIFNPAEFIGQGWSIWKGPVDGKGLKGEDDHDQANDTLTEVDFAQVVFDTCLNEGELSITGEEKLERLKAIPGRIRLGAKVGVALWDDYQKNKDNSILEWLYHEHQISCLDFCGDILRFPLGNRNVLCLCRFIDRWRWNMRWLGNNWDSVSRSAGLAK
jgi:hypothetical protein